MNQEHLTPTNTDHVTGPGSAGLVIVQYGDYTLQSCHQAQTAVSHMLAAFAGQIRFVYRHFVHERVNQAGFVAAKAAEAAAQQGKFWEIHTRFMTAEHPLTSADIVRHAQEAGLDPECYLKDIASDRSAGKIKNDLATGAMLGVYSVPAFFIGGERLSDPFSKDKLILAVTKAIILE